MSFSSALTSISTEQPELDHIVHLVPSGKLDQCVSAYKKLGFNVEKGGVHADGLTQNALIVLCDGVYIELIEFLEKPLKNQGDDAKETIHEWRERKSKHWWYGKKSGWVDWCLRGGVKDKRASNINKASQLGMERDKELAEPKNPNLVMYKEAVIGGRKTINGKNLKWNVTFPQGPQAVRGRYPFWCEDITPREWRVSAPSPHPNFTQGLAALTLLYYPETFPSRLASLQLILASHSGNPIEMLNCIVDLDDPPQTEGQSALPSEPVELYLSTPGGPPLPLRVKAAEDPDELQWLQENGEGLWEVEISVASEKLPPSAPPDGVERTTFALHYGRLRLHPIHVTAASRK